MKNQPEGSRPIALVTGAGSGIGREVALQLAGRGLRVVGAGRRPAELAGTVAQVEVAGGKAEGVTVDCATEAGLASLVDVIGERHVRVFVHAAGADCIKPLADTTRADFHALTAINVAAPLFLTQALLPRLADGAGIVFVGSVAAHRGTSRHALYGATKAALLGLTVNLASELAPRVRVNCVSPGATDTAMLAAFLRRSSEGLTEAELHRQHTAGSARMLLRRIAQPGEVAATVVHVALDATAMTGADIAVDVGYAAS